MYKPTWYNLLDSWFKMTVVVVCLAFLGQNSTTFSTRMIFGVIPISVCFGLIGIAWAIYPAIDYIKDTFFDYKLQKENEKNESIRINKK